MNCSFCNAKIPEGEKICPACGAAINVEDAIPAPSPYYAETVGEPAPAPASRKRGAKAAAMSETVPPTPESVSAEVVEPPVPAPATWEPPLELKSLADDKANWAIASLILGVLGLASCVMPGCCTILSSLPAIILGAMSLKSSRKSFATWGIVLGIIGFVILLGWVVMLVLGMVYGNNTSS